MERKGKAREGSPFVSLNKTKDWDVVLVLDVLRDFILFGLMMMLMEIRSIWYVDATSLQSKL
jgi:hypothetical protein